MKKNASETKAKKKKMVEANINKSTHQELLSCCFCDHVSPNTNKLCLLRYYLRFLFQLASPPGFHFNTHPDGEHCTMYKCVFLALRHFCLFRSRVISRVLGSVARREPAQTPYASLGPGWGPWHVLWGFKVASIFGEEFRARRAIQMHANPRTDSKNVPRLMWYLGSILNVINVDRHYLVMEMFFPDTNMPDIRELLVQ